MGQRRAEEIEDKRDMWRMQEENGRKRLKERMDMCEVRGRGWC